MSVEHLSLPSQNHTLAATLVSPERPPAAVLLRLGGGANLPHRPNLWQERLAGRGIASMGLDFAGVGESSGVLESTTLLTRLADASEVWQYLEDKFPEAPKYLMGVSMGAPIALWLAAETSPDGLILASPAAYSPEAHDKPYGPAFSAAIRQPEGWRRAREFDDLESFRGKVLLAYGDRDEVIPKEILRRYAEVVRRHEGAVIQLSATHTFLR